MANGKMTWNKPAELLLALAAIIALYGMAIPAYAEPLSIYLEPADAEQRTGPNVRWTIYLAGEIDVGAADRLDQEIAQIGDDRADVYMESPGGSLTDGMRIGRLLRRLQANTIVGKRGSRNAGIEPGACLSACSMAFLGGMRRFVPNRSVFGVHRVSMTVRSEQDFAAGQIVAAQVSGYIREMGVDSRLFERMAGTDKDRIYILSAAELRALHVVEDGKRPAQWQEQFSEQGPSLIGSQETADGTGQAVFRCDKGKLIFQSTYRARINAESLSPAQKIHSLLIDNIPQSLDAPISIAGLNGDLKAIFVLSPGQARGMIGAASIGHLMQGRRSDTPFSYKIDIDDRAGQAVKEFIEACST